MILYFLRIIIIIAFPLLYPTQGLCKDKTATSQSEGKTASVQAKKTKAHAWVNREQGVLETHAPIPVSSDIPFFDENGQPHNFEEFYGQVLLLNFWATWCTPCTQEMPALSQLQKDFKRKNFKVLAVSGDFKGVEVVRQFYDTYEINNLPIYHDPKNQLAKSFNISALPTSVIIDAEGNEIGRILGSAIDWGNEEFRQFILDHTDQKVYNVPSPPPTEVKNPASPATTPSKNEKAGPPAPKETVKAMEIPEKAVTVQNNGETAKAPEEKPDLADPTLRRPVNKLIK